MGPRMSCGFKLATLPTHLLGPIRNNVLKSCHCFEDSSDLWTSARLQTLTLTDVFNLLHSLSSCFCTDVVLLPHSEPVRRVAAIKWFVLWTAGFRPHCGHDQHLDTSSSTDVIRSRSSYTRLGEEANSHLLQMCLSWKNHGRSWSVAGEDEQK